MGMTGRLSAQTYSYSYTWADPNNCPQLSGSATVPNPNFGKNAGSCTFTYPTNKPFTQAKTLIVDNHLPTGSVLYAWDYNDFLPNFGWSCTSSGISQCANTVKSNAGITTFNPSFSLSTNLVQSGTQLSSGIYKTSIEGIGVKLYMKVSANTSYDRGSCNYGTSVISTYDNSGYISNPIPGNEIVLGYSNSISANLGNLTTYCVNNTNANVPARVLHSLKGQASYSIRAELIKTGDITSYGALSVIGADAGTTTVTITGQSPVNPGALLSGNAITIQPVACRLRGATDYQISLGRWVNLASNSVQPNVSLPYTGNIEPINLKLECSGKLDNVEFSFQDTGSSPLTNRNISLYDSIGGQSIDGLEVEMLYNDTRLNVHKIGEAVTTYKTNTGAHGSIKTNTQDFTYNSQSQAQFGARFIQRSAIKRNGVAYTGPVTGKVNMFVTYH